jgi:hypothetical protein
MDAVFLPEDHMFIMKEARKMDTSGLEKKRRKELVAFRVEVAQIRKDRENARKAKQLEDSERLSKVVLISRVEDIFDPAWKLTVPKLGEQLDALRLRGLPDVPATNNVPKKAERQIALKEQFIRYQAFLLQDNSLVEPSVVSDPTVQIRDNWEAKEDDVEDI